MSDFDVYNHGVPQRSLTIDEVDLLLSGDRPQEGDQTRILAILECLHRTEPTSPSDDVVMAFSARASEITLANSNGLPHPAGSTQPAPRGVVRRRLAGALGAAVLLTGMTGVAVADAAAPGDALYGLDRAMESIGVGASGTPERIAEAQTLLARGQVTAAITHSADAVEAAVRANGMEGQGFSPEAAKAVEALRGAAEQIGADQATTEDPAVVGSMAGIIGEIARVLDDDLRPSEIGARISQLARDLERGGENRASKPEDPSPREEKPGSQGNGNGRPDGRPVGPSGGKPTGPPDDVPGKGSGRP